MSSQIPPRNSTFNHRKYRAFAALPKADRRWPNRAIEQAPNWCSVDLRDGNQALVEPMSAEQKLELFQLLVDVGFKEIEVGFPAASQTDFDFVRQLIEQNHIPDDVTVQVLTQAREPLIARSFEALKGAKRAIIHLYNSTSPVQRQQVFNKSRQQIKTLAVQSAECVRDYAEKNPQTEWQFQYSPESFTATEMVYAVEICNAVTAVWQPAMENANKKIILNLPATVEVSTPNIYADQIEWFCDNIENRDHILISLHTHNDRGCGVAAAELGVMAGADRVEGTLLGNGERTGNMDIVTMAMNLYSQGIDPKLHFENMDRIINVIERCTQIKVHPRHPYAGELVFSAFSGSHQDAINKCLSIDQKRREESTDTPPWQVAYLPIDPSDLGRSYQQVIRINSQSGKGGVAYVLEKDHGIVMPRWLQIDFSPHIQRYAEHTEGEVSAEHIHSIFQQTYMNYTEKLSLMGYQATRSGPIDRLCAQLKVADKTIEIRGEGKGLLDAFVQALSAEYHLDLALIDYSEHTLGHTAEAEAMAYIQLSINGQRFCAAARSTDIVGASLQALLNAFMRSKR